jgi:aspartate/methionine/tyrosine aminotransferase
MDRDCGVHPMKINPFVMERTQCLHENDVQFNLSESGVQPLTIAEILPSAEARAGILNLPLSYPHSNGQEELRSNIAAFHGLADFNAVTVTNGGSEANFTTLWGLIEAEQRVAFMVPNYLQGFGLGEAWSEKVDTFDLVMDSSAGGGFEWKLDLTSLETAVSKDTGVIVVTNPNNPTGYVLSESEMDAIVRAAERAGAWLVVDEIYRGAEVSGEMTPTFMGRYDKVIVTGGTSKAFGLPGLRTGWIVAAPEIIRHLCQYHDYMTLTPSAISDHLANTVMREDRRAQVIERTRSIIRSNLPAVERWIESHTDIFDYSQPHAGAICTVRCKPPIESMALFEKVLAEQSVLITPGAHFGFGNYIRIGFGYNLDKTVQGLQRMDAVLEELKKN